MDTFMSIADGIRFHGKILVKGLWRVSCGAGTAGLIGLAVYGFTTIANEDGYVAVVNFMVAALILGMAFTFMYALGGGKRKRGGFEK